MPSKLRQLLLFFIILGLCLPGSFTHAQAEQGYVNIFSVDATKFPTVTTLLDAYDAQGQFIAGVTPAQMAVLEDGKPIKPDTVQEIRPPVSLVVAINSGPALGVRDGFGSSRYDKAAAVISNWAGARPSDSPDEYSLTWNGGILASSLRPAEWKTRFDAFDPAPRTSQPGLAALSFALDAAQNAKTVPGEKKAILLVSGHLDTQQAAGVDDLAARAKQAQIRIHVWIVDSAAYLEHTGAVALQNLATSTGGHFLTFTGSETLPDLEEWLAPMRHYYQMTYTTLVRSAGQHTLSVQINAAAEALTSPATDFELNVQPPNPVLLSPPLEIVRRNPDNPFEIETFEPKQQEISLLVEFPDGFRRELKRTTLLVDGQKVAENTSTPFTQFTWDLSGYIASGNHTLAVEAEDVLGMSSTSAAVTVPVTVVQPPGGVAGLILRNSSAMTIAAVVFAALVLLGILILGGRSFSTLAERRKARARKLDPVTQPVQIPPAPAPASAAPRANPFPWLRKKAPPPPAYFVKLTPDGHPTPGDPIPLTGSEMTFGTDPTQATNVLDHPSISPLHARLRSLEDGTFQLLDQNSVAGVWVNFEPLSKEGLLLKHGDMVNFGQLTYRFVLTKPPHIPKPTVTPL